MHDTPHDQGPPGQRRNALVIINGGLQAVVRRALLAHDLMTYRAEGAADALERLQVERHDMVVLDLVLADGTPAGDFTKQLRREMEAVSRKAWVLVMATSIRVSEVRDLRNCGVSSLLVGTLSLNRIEERVKLMRADDRRWIDAAGYVGPDRRVATSLFPADQNRRGQKKQAAQAQAAEPAEAA